MLPMSAYALLCYHKNILPAQASFLVQEPLSDQSQSHIWGEQSSAILGSGGNSGPGGYQRVGKFLVFEYVSLPEMNTETFTIY